MKRTIVYSTPTRAAVEVLGQQVARARQDRGWTIAQLAERVGVNPRTISNVERGSASVSLGTALEAAVLCGVPLFGLDDASLIGEARRGRELRALLPARVRPREDPVRDDF